MIALSSRKLAAISTKEPMALWTTTPSTAAKATALKEYLQRKTLSPNSKSLKLDSRPRT
jgi:adenylate kinase family enzyme